MKKLLIALAAVSCISSAFAEKVTTVDFDSTKMECHGQHIDDGISKDKVKGMHCKKYQDKKTDVVFVDDHSKKMVDCKVDNVGNITLAKCTSI